MTDAELVLVYTDIAATGHSLMGNYLTVLFAFLVTSYLAADKLGTAMAMVVLGLFATIASGMIMEIWLVEHDLAGLSGVIRESVANGSSSLAWHGSATYGWEERVSTLKLPSVIGAFGASIVFFLYERNVDHDTRSSRASIPND